MDVVAEEDVASYAAKLGLPLDLKCRGCSSTVEIDKVSTLFVTDEAITVRCLACAEDWIDPRA